MERKDSLRWYVGVPIVTNPLMCLDVLTVAALVLMGATVVIAAAQQFIGEGLSGPSLTAAAAYGAYLATAIVAAFIGFGMVLLGNRYTALYRLDDRGVYCETMRGARPLAGGQRLAYRAYPVEPLSPVKSGTRLLAWENVRSVQTIDSLRVILLKGGRGGTAMKVYCPDQRTFDQATRFLEQKLA